MVCCCLIVVLSIDVSVFVKMNEFERWAYINKADLDVVYGNSVPSSTSEQRGTTKFKRGLMMNVWDDRYHPTSLPNGTGMPLINVKKIAEVANMSGEYVCHIWTRELIMRKLSAS